MATLNRTQAIALADYATGVYEIPQMNLQQGAEFVYFEVVRCTTLTPDIWPNVATELKVFLELSMDAGATWTGLAGFGAIGGIHVLRTGGESAVSSLQAPLPAGNQRRIKGTAEVINGPLRTQGFFEARDGTVTAAAGRVK